MARPVREDMKFALTHLSGSLSGKTQSFDRTHLTLGHAPDNDLVIPTDGRDGGIPERVEMAEAEGGMRVTNTDPTVTILVNHNPLHEAILSDKDLIQLGPEGPKLRFRIRSGDFAASKSREEIWRDTLDMVAEDRRSGKGAVRPFVGHLTYEVTHYASKKTQLIVFALIGVMFGGLLVGGWYLYSALQREHERDLAALSEKLESARQDQALLERRTAEERQRLKESLTLRQSQIDQLIKQLEAQQQEGLGVTVEEVRALRKRLEALEAERTQTEAIIKQYGPSVCFLYIAYGFFKDGALSEVHSTPLEYMGTGFLIDRQGGIVTNRHIVEPWRMDPSTINLIEAGLVPKLLALRAYFPGHREPYTVSVRKISSEGDVAIGQLSPVPREIPPIPLGKPVEGVSVGESVVILGYPVGVEALLARMDPEVVGTVLRESGQTLKSLVQAIADRHGIRPLANQGIIGDIVPGRVIYDAPTTGGASGSPVFNRHGEVIAVNARIMRKFEGANAGVPIEIVLDLLSSSAHTN